MFLFCLYTVLNNLHFMQINVYTHYSSYGSVRCSNDSLGYYGVSCSGNLACYHRSFHLLYRHNGGVSRSFDGFLYGRDAGTDSVA